MRLSYLFIFLFALGGNLSRAQHDPRQPVEISGVVVTADSLPQFIPYAHISVKARKHGTMSSGEGFFSFAALPSDTLTISCIGFKEETLVVPDTVRQNAYLARVVLRRDTTMLDEVNLYPWPRPEHLKRELLAARIPTTKRDIAMRNLAMQELKARAAELGYSPEELQDYTLLLQQQNVSNYAQWQGYANGGTAILGRLSDPFAWARFFKSLSKDE